MRGRRRIEKLLAWTLIFSTAHLVTGCGTLISGRHQDLKLSIAPSDAKVSVYRWNGELVAGPTVATEGKMKVHRPEWRQPYLVQVSKDGYCPRYSLTTTGNSPGSWLVLPFVLAIAVFPIAGLIVTGALTAVDASTGGCCSVMPDKVDAQLVEASACEK